MYKLIIICCECRKKLKEKLVERKEEAGKSHTWCPDCLKKMNELIEEL